MQKGLVCTPCIVKPDGRTTFGIKEVAGKLWVMVPQFDVTGHTQKFIEACLMKINGAVQLRHEADCEKRLKEALQVELGVRVVTRGEKLVPLDQEAALLLFKLGLPLLLAQRHFSI